MNRKNEAVAAAVNAGLRPYPKKMQVEITTRCNMRCSMCVKYAPGSDIRESDLDLETFKNLGPSLEHCEALVLNGIGEPLLHPQLPDMVEFARSHMPEKGWIGFQTNGLLLTEKLAERLVQAGADTFCISVDSLEEGPDNGELHGQSSVERLSRAFSLLAKAGEKYGRSLRLGIEVVLMKDNFEQLPAVISWAVGQGAGFVVCSHVLTYDETMQGQSIFNPNTPAATALFNKWQQKAVENGLDLHDYYDVVWKFSKSPEEKMLADFVREMMLEGKEMDVWLHFRSLLDWNKRGKSGDWSRVLEVSSEAERVAQDLGIELRMPSFEATDELSCSFIEESVAFITSEGAVSPCQFLWHGHSCHLDGSEKRVKPQVFGYLGIDDFQKVWRSAEYEEFRLEVLGYAYPYCSNCPLVPCDDITGKSYDFEHDCLGAKVPCGHCPWAMGGLQCLI